MQLIGSDSKLHIDENGNLINAYWGDTFSIPVYKKYSRHVRDVFLSYLVSKKSNIAEFISYCDISEYEIYRHDDMTFIISISDFLESVVNIKSEICSYLSKELEKGPLIDEIKNIEIELENSECIINQIIDL